MKVKCYINKVSLTSLCCAVSLSPTSLAPKAMELVCCMWPASWAVSLLAAHCEVARLECPGIQGLVEEEALDDSFLNQ